MKIVILTVSGYKSEEEVRNGDTVESLKHKLARSQHVGFDQIRLLFDGQAMQTNQRTIASYDVKEGDTIHLVVDNKVTINVTVEMPDGKSRVFTVNSNEEVDKFKHKIQQATGFQVDTIQLFFQSKAIEGGKLMHFDIKDGSRVKLRLKKIEVTVRKLDGKTLTMEISHSDTVEEFKSRLYNETNVPVAQQRLLCNGRQLESGLLTSYDIRCGSIINMVGRLRGG